MVQAKWGSMRWEITDEVFKTLTSISTSQSVKKQTNNDNEGSSAISNQGLELQQVPLIFNVIRGLGVDPYDEFKKWQSRLTQVNSLYVGGRRFGAPYMQLDSAGIAAIELDNTGKFLVAEISLNFTESAEEASEAKLNGTTGTGETKSGVSVKPSQAEKNKMKFKEIRLEPPKENIGLTPSQMLPRPPEGFTRYVEAPIFYKPKP